MTDETETQVTWEQVKELLPDKIELIYVDYRDNLDENLSVIEECIHLQSMEPLWDIEFGNDWFSDQQYDSIDYYINNELKPEIAKLLDVDEDDDIDELVDAVIEEHRDMIKETLFDRDTSTPLDDLLRNTSDPILYYSLGTDIATVYDEEDMVNNLQSVKSALCIADDKYDDRLSLMIAQASYGGELVVFFRASDWVELFDVEDNNVIAFKNPMVAIVDRCNGSGDHVELDGYEFEVALNPESINIDKVHDYSYTYKVCGMYEDWCECTDATVKKVDYPASIQAILDTMQETLANYRAMHNICV